MSRPASSPSRVLLPLPDAPIIATNCPRGTVKLTSRRISTRFEPLSMNFESRSTRIISVWRSFGCMSILDCEGTGVFTFHFCSLLRLPYASRFLQLTQQYPLKEKREPATVSSGTFEKAVPPAPAETPDKRPVIVAFGDSLTAGVAGRGSPEQLDFTRPCGCAV